MIPAGTPLGAVQVAIPGAPVVGLVAPGGQQVNLGKLEGWWDAPASSGSYSAKVNAHGAYLTPGYYGARIMTLEARIDGWSPGDSLSLAQDLLDAIDVNLLKTMSVTDEKGTLTAAVRQEGKPLLTRQGNRMVLNVMLVAPDARRYGPMQQASTGLPVSTGGFTLPVVLPVSTGAVTDNGILVVNNDGDLESNPDFTIRGPVPAGTTITDGDGRQLRINEAIPAGRTLNISTGDRVALLDGVATRPVSGSWPVLKPGVNQYSFNATAYDAGAQLTVYYRSARR